MTKDKIKKVKEIVALCIFLSTTACSHMNSDFTCPMTGGIHCESLDSVNGKVDRHEIQGLQEVSDKKIVSVSPEPLYIQEPTIIPVRQEKPLHIWIAPFYDREGNYHAANNIYAVITPNNLTKGAQDV